MNALSEHPVTEGALVVAAHALRELVNMLPTVLADVSLPERVRDADVREVLIDAWCEVMGTPGFSESAKEASVPHAFIVAMREYVEAQQQIQENAEARRSALVLGNPAGQRDDATVALVRAAINRIERFRHPAGDTTGWLPTGVQRFKSDLQLIERALLGRVGNFFDVVDQLQTLLGQANETGAGAHGEGGWRRPSRELVEAAMSRLGDLQHRRVFFDGLKNPLWLPLLDEVGVFNHPPLEQVGEDGRIQWVPWPQGDYLVAIARQVPGQVAAILLRKVGPEAAPWVKEQVVLAALEMSPESAAQLTNRIASFLDQRQGPSFGLEIVSLIEHLAAGGRSRQAERLAHALLRPAPVEEETGHGEHAIRAGIEEIWYGEALSRVVAALANHEKLLSMLTAWLEEEQLITKCWDEENGDDFSYIRRPSISDHSQNYGTNEMDEALIDAVRDVALQRLRQGNDPHAVIEVLNRSRVPLLRRIAFYVVSKRLPDDHLLRPLATAWLLDPQSMDSPAVHREYLQLAAAALPTLGEGDYQTWERMILRGPKLTEDQMQRIIAMGGESGTRDQAVSRYIQDWQLTRLSSLGADALRGAAEERLRELVALYGEPKHPSFLTWHSIGTGQTNPFSLEDLLSKNPQEAIELLRTWQPEDDAARILGRSDLADVFAAVVARRPADYSALTHLIMTHSPNYLGALLSGLRVALKENSRINWEVLLAASAAFDQAHDSAGAQSGRRTNFRRQLCGLLENGAVRSGAGIPDHLLPAAAELVIPYLNDSDPTPDYERKHGGSQGDPLHLSLNTVRPVAIRTLVQLAAAEYEITPDEQRPGTITQRVIDAFARLLTPERDSSVAVAAAFGESTGWLLRLAPDWYKANSKHFLTNDTFGDIVATTALAFHPTSRHLMEALEGKVTRMIASALDGTEIADSVRSNRSPLERIGDHLIILLMWGTYSFETPLVTKFFKQAPVEARASSLGHLAWLFMQTEEGIPDEVLHQAQSLWDSRSKAVKDAGVEPKELSKFYWWVHCGKFPVAWWLPRLEEASAVTDLDGIVFLAKHLEEASEAYPEQAIAILDRLIRSGQESHVRHRLTRNAPVVIARALDSSDAQAILTGRDLMNWLGRQGNLQIAELVAQARTN
ncbi:hypothetical protein ACTAQI_15250 [Pseudarthrobacter sp. alpha12b]